MSLRIPNLTLQAVNLAVGLVAVLFPALATLSWDVILSPMLAAGFALVHHIIGAYQLLLGTNHLWMDRAHGELRFVCLQLGKWLGTSTPFSPSRSCHMLDCQPSI
jgi:hypothetical protein